MLRLVLHAIWNWQIPLFGTFLGTFHSKKNSNIPTSFKKSEKNTSCHPSPTFWHGGRPPWHTSAQAEVAKPIHINFLSTGERLLLVLAHSGFYRVESWRQDCQLPGACASLHCWDQCVKSRWDKFSIARFFIPCMRLATCWFQSCFNQHLTRVWHCTSGDWAKLQTQNMVSNGQ